MSIFWTVPAALIGISLVALPIAVHLLTRQNIAPLPFPSLRFLRQTQLACFRRRSIEDLALLLCRAAIVALAAIALAGPVLQTASRHAAYAGRTSRAIVLAGDGVDRDLVDRSREGTFASTVVVRLPLGDALMDAERWLNQQPPSSREILMLGALRRGALNDADVSTIDRDIGLRFLPQPVETRSTLTMPVLTRRGGALVAIDRQVSASVDATRVTDGPATPVAADLVQIVASEADTPLAEAALRAALEAGVPWSNFNQHIVIAWDGATPDSKTPNTRIVRMPVPSPPAAAADAVRDVLLTVSRPALREPVLIAQEQLDAWAREPGPPFADAPIVDEGDRRWLWVIVLLLLMVEWRLRRSSKIEMPQAAAEEARVA